MKRNHINKPYLSAQATLSSCHRFCFVAKKPSALTWIHCPPAAGSPASQPCAQGPGGAKGAARCRGVGEGKAGERLSLDSCA